MRGIAGGGRAGSGRVQGRHTECRHHQRHLPRGPFDQGRGGGVWLCGAAGLHPHFRDAAFGCARGSGADHRLAGGSVAGRARCLVGSCERRAGRGRCARGRRADRPAGGSDGSEYRWAQLRPRRQLARARRARHQRLGRRRGFQHRSRRAARRHLGRAGAHPGLAHPSAPARRRDAQWRRAAAAAARDGSAGGRMHRLPHRRSAAARRAGPQPGLSRLELSCARRGERGASARYLRFRGRELPDQLRRGCRRAAVPDRNAAGRDHSGKTRPGACGKAARRRASSLSRRSQHRACRQPARRRPLAAGAIDPHRSRQTRQADRHGGRAGDRPGDAGPASLGRGHRR